jgi:3'-5' exoribonuclease
MNKPDLNGALFSRVPSTPAHAAIPPSSRWIATEGFPPPSSTPALPAIARLLAIARFPNEKGSYRNDAKIYTGGLECFVTWISPKVDSNLRPNTLVLIAREANGRRFREGHQRIHRLTRLDTALPWLNLFTTVPPGWVGNAGLLVQAAALWDTLPRPLAHLFNAALWDGGRFYRYLTVPEVPTARQGWNGTFAHCVATAHAVKRLVSDEDAPVLITAALLHDAAKGDACQRNRCGNRLHLSERFRYLGPRNSLLEWLAVARYQHKVIIAENTYLWLINRLLAVPMDGNPYRAGAIMDEARALVPARPRIPTLYNVQGGVRHG